MEPTQTQRELNEALYLAVCGDPKTPYKMFWLDEHDIIHLLQKGANPNYRPKFGRLTIAEYVMKHLSRKSIHDIILKHSTAMLDPRPGHLDSSPLMLLMTQIRAYSVTEKDCLAVYARMSKPAHERSPLLFSAIDHGLFDLAKALIADRHAFSQEGYYHACCRNNVAGIAQLLYEKGYRLTGMCTTKYMRGTALEVAIMSRAWRVLGVLLPFAEITFYAIDHFMQKHYCSVVIELMSRCRIRDLPMGYIGMTAPCHPMLRILLMHQEGIPVISEIMEMDNSAESLFKLPPIFSEIEYDDEYSLKNTPMRPHYKRVHLRDEFVAALLRQGEPLHASLCLSASLRDALLPLNEETIRKYCSRAFRVTVFSLVLAVELCPGLFLPFEMKMKIAGFMKRDV
jgi:hypothetical protein